MQCECCNLKMLPEMFFKKYLKYSKLNLLNQLNCKRLAKYRPATVPKTENMRNKAKKVPKLSFKNAKLGAEAHQNEK